MNHFNDSNVAEFTASVSKIIEVFFCCEDSSNCIVDSGTFWKEFTLNKNWHFFPVIEWVRVHILGVSRLQFITYGNNVDSNRALRRSFPVSPKYPNHRVILHLRQRRSCYVDFSPFSS